jgi:hypothetical protein
MKMYRAMGNQINTDSAFGPPPIGGRAALLRLSPKPQGLAGLGADGRIIVGAGGENRSAAGSGAVPGAVDASAEGRRTVGFGAEGPDATGGGVESAGRPARAAARAVAAASGLID